MSRDKGDMGCTLYQNGGPRKTMQQAEEDTFAIGRAWEEVEPPVTEDYEGVQVCDEARER